MEQVTHWHPLREQKKNNRGASLIMVLSVIALVMIIVAIILSLALMNYRMKVTNKKSVDNFYTTEQAVEEIRTGLVYDLSETVATVYNEIMTNYSKNTSEEREELYTGRMKKALLKKYETTSNSGIYNLTLLQTYTTKKAYDSANPQEDRVDVTTPTPNTTNHINTGASDLTLMNLKVTYYGKNGYVNTIKTDIKLKFPEIDFKKNSGVTPIMAYSLIANRSLQVKEMVTGVTLRGNVYMGEKEAIFGASSQVDFPHSAPKRELETLVVAGGPVQLKGDARLTMDGTRFWAEDLILDSADMKVTDGTVYVRNDVRLQRSGNGPSITISGNLYGFGNPTYLAEAASVKNPLENITVWDKNNEPQKGMLLKDSISASPADYSSSVIINGSKSTVDFTGLKEMLLAGNAYINAASKNDELLQYNQLNGITTTQNEEDTKLQTGESISVRRNQTAYLIPAECVKSNSPYGATNPMTANEYEALRSNANGDHTKMVDFDRQINDFGKSLRELGVTDFTVTYYPVKNAGPMAYLFMQFQSTTDADQFFSTYYDQKSQIEHYAKLQQNLDLYTTDTAKNHNLKLPGTLDEDRDSSEEKKFYYNGNVILNDGSENAFRTASLIHDSDSEDTWKDVCMESQDTFAALNHVLREKYEQITEEQAQLDVYDNLIYDMGSVNHTVEHIVAPGKERKFITQGADPVVAVVVNNKEGNPYHIDSTTIRQTVNAKDSSGPKEGDLCFVIASGDVVVDTDFVGTIIAKGDITIAQSGIEIKPDHTKVAKAFLGLDKDGVSICEYVKNAEAYIIGGTNDPNGDKIEIQDLVLYENWSKDKSDSE